MAATLLLVFRSRLRLLPLAIALAAAGITFGALSLVGGTLTMASIAVLPILIGLAVDYAIQFQSRARGGARVAGPSARAVRGRRPRARPLGAPTIASRRSRPRPASSCCCSRRCRWSAASGCCSWSASSSRSSARSPLASAAIVLADRDGGVARRLACAEPARSCAAPARDPSVPAGCEPLAARGARLRARRRVEVGRARDRHGHHARPGACSRSARCWRCSAGSPTRRPRSSPT